MCNVNRREFLAKGTAFLSVAAEADILRGAVPETLAKSVKVDQLAPDVYFHQGIADPDHAAAVCNNGWILFNDYVLVIDANYPAGAQLMITQIRGLTDSQSALPSTHITTVITATATKSMSTMERFR